MKYELKIIKRDINPEYKESQSMSGIYNQRYDVPQYIDYNVLSCELTEEEFKKVKLESLKVFE